MRELTVSNCNPFKFMETFLHPEVWCIWVSVHGSLVKNLYFVRRPGPRPSHHCNSCTSPDGGDLEPLRVLTQWPALGSEPPKPTSHGQLPPPGAPQPQPSPSLPGGQAAPPQAGSTPRWALEAGLPHWLRDQTCPHLLTPGNPPRSTLKQDSAPSPPPIREQDPLPATSVPPSPHAPLASRLGPRESPRCSQPAALPSPPHTRRTTAPPLHTGRPPPRSSPQQAALSSKDPPPPA